MNDPTGTTYSLHWRVQHDAEYAAAKKRKLAVQRSRLGQWPTMVQRFGTDRDAAEVERIQLQQEGVYSNLARYLPSIRKV